MANDYTAWPSPALVLSRLTNLGVTPRVSLATDDTQGILDDLTASIARETLRQFVAGSPGEVRYYDGSGTGSIDIDEFIALASTNPVMVIGFIGASGLALPNVVPVVRQGRPNFRIEVARGSLPSIGRIWLDRFPEGRQNIQVTAQFGYGLAIPADLWQAVLDESAVRIATMTVFNPAGRVQAEKLGDVSTEYSLKLPGELIGSEARLKAAIKRYRKPAGARLKKLATRMI